MKKLISLLLVLMFVCLSLTACGNETKPDQNIETNLTEQNSTLENEIDSSNVETQWGVEESIVTEKGNSKARAYIKFPYLAGITEGTGKIAYQTDNSLVILDSQFKYSTVDADIDMEEILPSYFEQTVSIISAYRRVDHKDFKFEIINKETLKVNDYDMCKYTGKHTFTHNGNSKSISFVAYSTKLKSNDAAVYWMVLDDTAEQSLGSTIESHADKMAESLHE